jgi:hypothetical protein
VEFYKIYKKNLMKISPVPRRQPISTRLQPGCNQIFVTGDS